MKKKIKKALRTVIATCAVPFFREKAEAELREKWQSFGLECSNICNANCSFCGYGKGLDPRKKEFVDEETLKAALKLYEKSGGGDFVFGSILGDPLADRSFLEKVHLIRQSPSVTGISIYTNVIGLRNFDIDNFVTSGITNIAVSTCIGGKDVYKRLFGVDAYDTVMEDIIKLLEANRVHGNPIDVKILIRTDYDILQRIDSFSEYKAIRKYLDPRKIRLLSNDDWDDYNGTVGIGDLPKGANLKENVEDKSVPCYALYRKLQVLKNGDIAVCSCRISPYLVVDNISNYSTLDEYWTGPALQAFRKKWHDGKVPSICRTCTHYLPYTHAVEGIVVKKVFDKLRKIRKRF